MGLGYVLGSDSTALQNLFIEVCILLKPAKCTEIKQKLSELWAGFYYVIGVMLNYAGEYCEYGEYCDTGVA